MPTRKSSPKQRVAEQEPSRSRAARERSAPREPDVQRLRRDLKTYMNDHGLRASGPRRVVVDVFFECRDHLSVDELLERARQVDERISYTTVYRTMKMLVAGGIAHEHRFGDGFTRYELADEDAHHDHLICTECGQIIEFEEPLIEELQTRIAERYGFEVFDHKHELYGICAACQQKREKRAEA